MNRTKEQIAEGMKNVQEVKRKQGIITEQFYPALIKATISVEEAKMLIQALGSLIMEEVLKTMKERKFSEIKDILIEKLTKEGRKEEIVALLDTLKEENLFTARELIEGMSNAIQQMIIDEMQNRKLDSMKIDWNRYLNMQIK